MKYFNKILLVLICVLSLGLFACNDPVTEAPTSGEILVPTPTPDEPTEEEKVISNRMIYVSPDGSGDVGTESAPCNFITANIIALPGDTILLASGTYKYNQKLNLTTNGYHNARITIKPQEEGGRVVFDFSGMNFDSAARGIQVYGDYWYIYGIEVCGAGDNGLYICGNNNIVENCQFYNNRDSGLQLGRGFSSETSIDQWPSNNLIKNCTSFNNYDDVTLGENADGFAAKLTVGYGNIFDGCIAYRNSDDGWDLYGKEDSGNIGNVYLYNCVSFENGFVATNLGTEEEPNYNTPNGDGIGFKLGGSTMEGDVVIDNCVAFNNKLHGFGDNSNPGVIQMRHCTAFNNCIGLNPDGTVKAVRGVDGEENKSNNFDMARDTNSYNSYYGLLSYINNQVGYPNLDRNTDAFRGATAYSIFQTSYDDEAKKEIYLMVRDYTDASSYAGDSLELPTETYQLSDADFADLSSVNAIGDKMYQIHELFRNEDLSVNIGDLLRLVNEELLTFVEGKPIGAVLNKNSMADYYHPSFTTLPNTATDAEIALQNCYDVLDVLTNIDAVYQDFELPVYLNNCDITWESSNPDIIEIIHGEKISLSAASYINARVKLITSEQKVKLTATIHYEDETLEKEFEITVKPRANSLGALVSDVEDVTFIIGRYQTFTRPNITVTDASSNNGSALDPSLYDLEIIYEYSTDRDGIFTRVNEIYTSVPGVFKVTTKATSKIPADNGKTMSHEYFVYIGDDECDIDFMGGIHKFNINATGFNISATLTNISGRIYAVVTDNDTLIFSPEEVVNHPDVQTFLITSDEISFNFEADNSIEGGYRVYYAITDKVGRNYSNLYGQKISSTSISTCQEFYDLAQGISPSSKDMIYNLTTDLDFSNYEWKDAENPAQFVGTFNGNGHTISNVTVVSNIQKQANLFYKLGGGTIMNTNFTNISITNTLQGAKLVGIVGGMDGGYISNINITNISCKTEGLSSGSVGGLVGQIINGTCYIDHITLENDENQVISCTNKYVGGIVGNIQQDSNMTEAKVYISYCVVKADLGDGKDVGGCIGGIVGRVKNEKTSYHLEVNNCYYKGTITVYGNYNAGIVGSLESGTGSYNLSNNFADVIFVHKGILLDARAYNALEEEVPQEYAHKNCNPICGRASSLTGDRAGSSNVGSWSEYYKTIIISTSMYFMNGPDFVPNADYFASACGWDLEQWNIDDNGNVSLK